MFGHFGKYYNASQVKSFTYYFGMLCCLLGMASCSTEYNISGDSDITTLDGRMLYLRAPHANTEMKSIDSCEVIHGKFSFMGNVDSTSMGEIFMDNEGLMPIVIENGNLTIRITSTGQRIEGGTLNERMYKFIEQKERLQEEIFELSDEEAHMILSGINPILAHRKVQQRNNELYDQMERLETNFIIANSDNILGLNFFFNMVCTQNRFPMMTRQIEQIMKKSHSNFRKNPQVRSYIQAAEENMKLIRTCGR